MGFKKLINVSSWSLLPSNHGVVSLQVKELFGYPSNVETRLLLRLGKFIKAHYLVAQHTTYPLDQIELQLLNFHRCTSFWRPRTIDVCFSGLYSHACLDHSPDPYRNENFSLAQRALLHPAMNGCLAWSRRRLRKEAQYWQGAEVCPFVCDCEWSASHPGLE